MTCIVGIAHKDGVTIGGDSLGVGGYDCLNRADEKVFFNGEYLIGYTSSFRMGQILRYRFEPPQINTWDVRRFMATTFVDAVRKAFEDGGYLRKESGEESGGTFLVGVRGQLFQIEDDFQVGVPMSGYDACGCGARVAWGALAVTEHLAPEDRVRTALEAAERHSAGVRGPFVIMHQPVSVAV